MPPTVIMTAVPAQVGGVKDIVRISPPHRSGSIHPVILALCHELGIQAVVMALQEQVQAISRSEITVTCLEQFSAVIVCQDMNHIIDQANAFASEHLEIQCGGTSEAVAARIHNAGALFIGPYTPVAVDDYWAAPGHTLPTGQTARFFSPISSNDFVKTTSVIRYDEKMLRDSAADIVRLADVEGLDAHAKSVTIRGE